MINTSAVSPSPLSCLARNWSLPWSLGCWSAIANCAKALLSPCGSVPVSWSNLFGWNLPASSDAPRFTASSSISRNPSVRLPACGFCPLASRWTIYRFRPARSSSPSCTTAARSFATFSAAHLRSSLLHSSCFARSLANLLWPLAFRATARWYRKAIPIANLLCFRE